MPGDHPRGSVKERNNRDGAVRVIEHGVLHRADAGPFGARTLMAPEDDEVHADGQCGQHLAWVAVDDILATVSIGLKTAGQASVSVRKVRGR